METKKHPRVFAVCEPTHIIAGEPVKSVNLKPAIEYGDVHILLQNNQTMFATVPTIRTLRDKLHDFGDDDFILPVGDPVLMSMVAMVASDINHGRVNYLKWDKKARRYYSIQTDVHGKAL